jgi:hypothetical protein
MSERTPGFIERARKWWWVVALLTFGGALIWYSNVKQAAGDIAGDIDSLYHEREAAVALIQLARMPGQSGPAVVRYMATFENRSDEPLLVTGVVYEIQPVGPAALASGDQNASANITLDAGQMQPTGAYDLQQPCEGGASEALVPPFRLQPKASGSFEIKVRHELTSADASWCRLEVRFKTNQGETNGIIPD